jgi:tetratricopeptide (TPR) repeat protein
MSIRKEQVLLILVILMAGYCSQDYFEIEAMVPRSGVQQKELEVGAFASAPLVDTSAEELVRRDFLTEPSETRPLPPRELGFPPRAPFGVAGLPLDPGPDFRHAWMLRQDGGQIDGVSLSANEAPVEDVAQDDQEPSLGAMSEEQAAKLYDRVWIANLSPQYCRIEPQADIDLLKLEADGDFNGVTLRARIFSRKKKVLGKVVTLGGDSVGSSITKIMLADTIRNEVRRQLRKVPENAGNQGERLELIRWLLHQARSESWIYEIALKQAEVYMQMSGGTLDGFRVMQVVLQETGDLEGELDLLEQVSGDAAAQSFRLQGLGVIKARLGLWIEAEEHLKEAAALTPTNAHAHGALAEFYRSRGRSREAVTAAARAEQTLGSVQDPDLRGRIERTILGSRLAVGVLANNGNLTAASPYVRGCMHYAAGDMSAAMSAFQQVGPGPDASPAQLGQAAALANMGQFQEAYDIFQSVADQDPLLRHRALTGLALICSRLGDFESAITYADRALEAAPNDTYALYLRGRTLRLMGQYAAAQEALSGALRNHDDFVQAIAEMSLSFVGLASTSIGTDQASALISARRYMDRAVSLSPAAELELLENQGLRAFAAADARAARNAFEQARDLAANEESKGYARGALCVVSYSRGRVEDAEVNLQRLERDSGRESVIGKWAGATLDAIVGHAEKEALGDSFERERPGEIWVENQDGRLGVAIDKGRLVLRGTFNKGEVSAERANAVRSAKNFLACSVSMELGPRHDVANSEVGLGIETRRARKGVDFSARVYLKGGRPFVTVQDGRDSDGDKIVDLPLPMESRRVGYPQDLELRVVPRADGSSRQRQLQVYFNDALVMTHELKQLTGSTQVELKTVLFATGDRRARVDVAFDNYRLERRKDKR